jgi:hypothetical protein
MRSLAIPALLATLLPFDGLSGQIEDGQNLMEDLFRQDAENVFMLKVSYWITP